MTKNLVRFQVTYSTKRTIIGKQKHDNTQNPKKDGRFPFNVAAYRLTKKALHTVKKNSETARLEISRTNQCAERGIKYLQDLYDVCIYKE